MYHAFWLVNILSLNINLDKVLFYYNSEYNKILLFPSDTGTFLLIATYAPVLEKYVALFHMFFNIPS